MKLLMALFVAAYALSLILMYLRGVPMKTALLEVLALVLTTVVQALTRELVSTETVTWLYVILVLFF